MYAQIIIDITNEALDRAYTYRIPEGMEIKVGDRVSIPFGRMKKSGYVIDIVASTNYEEGRIKDIIGLVKGSVSMQEQLIRLAVWMSREYGTTLNQCLKTVLPVKRSIRKNARRIDPIQRYLGEEDRRVTLNEEQTHAVEVLRTAFHNCLSKEEEVTKEDFEAPRYLLHGITGSGKTEVYLNVMEEVIQNGKQLIFLIPEISLTYQTVLRVSRRFQGRVAILNSRMSQGERYEQYRKCENGEVDVLIGPRSAVFAPFERLGLIIMDEEHEGAYKSETAPRYECRDVAYQRAIFAHCPVLYGSATPSLRIYKRAMDGEVEYLSLTKRAKEGSRLAKTEIVDMRAELDQGNRSIFSARLAGLMQEKLEKGEQIMLFLNRRGYSNFISCRSCGSAIKCPHCDVSLTYHIDGRLRCHYCGFEAELKKICPSCGSRYIAPFGFGTEKLERMTKDAFPKAHVLRMDADTTKNKGGHEEILEVFRKKEADILIGTQMIVKGHDFPDVTLVGMILADTSLSAPDIGATERSFQLLTQAAGRAGRGENPGNVIIQTYQPEHYVMNFSKNQDFIGFYRREMEFRKLLGYPPYEYLLSIQLSSGNEDFLDLISRACVSEFHHTANLENAELLGPFNASVYKVKDIFRKIIYIKHKEHDIIIKLRQHFSAILRNKDKQQLIMQNFDLL